MRETGRAITERTPRRAGAASGPVAHLRFHAALAQVTAQLVAAVGLHA